MESATSSLSGLRPSLASRPRGGVVELLLAGAKISRGPVQLAQAVEDGAGDADARVLAEGEITAGAKTPGGVDQADGTGLDQIVELHRGGQAAEDGARDLLDVVQWLRDELLLLVFSRQGTSGGGGNGNGAGSEEK